MIIVALILFGLMIGCFLKARNSDDGDSWMMGGSILILAWLIAIASTLNIQFGTQQLTGYIYSSDDRMGYTVGHLRFSENAGADSQPKFCAPSNSKAAQQIRELAGSGKKVEVVVPPYFYLSNNPFACGTDKVTITEK